MSDTNGKALIPIGTQAPPISLTEMMTIGKILASSGFFADVRGEAQAVAKILAGQEAGFGPMAAMTGIHIVKGKIVIGANLMAAKVKSSGRYNYRIKRLDDAGCVLEFTENGKPVGESTFTLEDATKAGLGQGDNWKHYPRNMLFARAISNGVRWYCADVFNGTTVYTPEEMGDDRLPEMAVVEDVTVSDVTPAQIAQNSERESVREAMEGPPAHAQPVSRVLPQAVEPEVHTGTIYTHNALCPKDCDSRVWQRWCNIVADAEAAKIPLWEFEPMDTAAVLYMGKQVRARLDTLKASQEYEQASTT